jgi:RNA polymerase sigma factor (sigma-70 family)
MTAPSFGTTLRQWLYGLDDSTANLSDAQLLQRFLADRDDAAFARLVQRHGPMVLGLCRRLLRDAHDADDAFQAAFLVLACRAGSIRHPESLVSFLHGTAYRIGQRLRRQSMRRQEEQRQAARCRPEAVLPPEDEGETHALLHEELQRLPRKYRDVLILCYLQGKTHEEAARALGYPAGSMSRHLSRARERLRQRLMARGVVASVLATVLGTEPVSAALLCGTLDTVRRHALASALLTGTAPPMAVVLAQGILRAASPLRWMAATLVLTVGLVFAGGMAAMRMSAEKETPTEANRQRELPGKEQPPLDLYGDPLPDGVLVRMGTMRLRHAGAAQAVFAADGKTLLTVGRDPLVRFWDIHDGKLRRIQRMPLPDDVSRGQGSRAVLSPDGKTLAQATARHLFLWRIADAKEMHRIPVNTFGLRGFDWLTFTPDGKTLAGSEGTGTGAVRLWDVVGGKESKCLQHKDILLRNGVFSPDGKRLAVSGDNHAIIWDLPGGKETRILRLPKGSRSNALAFSPNGQTLAYSNLTEVILWNAATGKQEAELHFGAWPGGWINHYLAFAPDGKTLAVGVDGLRQIVLWDRTRGKRAKTLDGYIRGPLYFSPDGKWLASLFGGKIQLWDVAEGKELQERVSHREGVESLAFTPDGKRLASSSYYGDSIYLWDVQSGRRLAAFSQRNAQVRQIVFSADGKTLIAGGNTIQLWDAANGKRGRAFPLYERPENPEKTPSRLQQFLRLSLSSDGKRLTALSLDTGHSADGFLHDSKCFLTSWDVAGGKRLEQRDCPPSFKGMSFSPDGKLLALPTGWGIKIHDVAAHRDLCTLKNINSGPVAFSPDGRILAAGAVAMPDPADADADYRKKLAAEKVQLWDVMHDKELLQLDTGTVYGRAFSPDGRYLVTAAMDGLRLWEIASGKQVLYRPAPEKLRSALLRSFATCLAFAPDGRSVATGHDDTNILLWDMAPETRRKRALKADDLDSLWSDLAGTDAARAYRAAGTLIACAEHSVPYLRRRLTPIAEPSPRLRRLIADLDSEQFAVREAARKELRNLGDAAHPALRQALKDKPSLELRKNIQSLLPDTFVVRSPEKLRQIRAIMVLEQIGDTAARRLLQRLTEGTAEARQTREAKAALQRLEARR